jgi:hypothetical protein
MNNDKTASHSEDRETIPGRQDLPRHKFYALGRPAGRTNRRRYLAMVGMAGNNIWSGPIATVNGATARGQRRSPGDKHPKARRPSPTLPVGPVLELSGCGVARCS